MRRLISKPAGHLESVTTEIVTAQNIVIVRDRPGGHMIRYMAGGEVEFEGPHLARAAAQSFNDSLDHHRRAVANVGAIAEDSEAWPHRD